MRSYMEAWAEAMDASVTAGWVAAVVCPVCGERYKDDAPLFTTLRAPCHPDHAAVRVQSFEVVNTIEVPAR